MSIITSTAKKTSSSSLANDLTKRELEVLYWVVQGKTNAQVAEELIISTVTVNAYLRSIYSKLGVSSRTQAIRYAMEHDLYDSTNGQPCWRSPTQLGLRDFPGGDKPGKSGN